MKTQWTAVLIAAMLVTGAVTAWAEGSQAACCSTCPTGKEVAIWGDLASKPKTAEAYKPEKVIIGIGSFDMFELKNGAAGYSLTEREVAVYNRLVEILSKVPAVPEAVCVGRVRTAPTIYVGPYRLVSVYAQDAAAAGMTQDELAEKWRARLSQIVPKVATTEAWANRFKTGLLTFPTAKASQ